MTYTYINPDTKEPTKVPAAHYEKNIRCSKRKKYMGEITSRQFLTIMYNQLNALKKKKMKNIFNRLYYVLTWGINPKDLRVDEQIAIAYTHDYIEDKQKNKKKKNFHLLSRDIIDTYIESKESPIIQAEAIEPTNEYEDNLDYDI